MYPEDLEELLDSKINLHDKNRFEVKLDVVLSPEQVLGDYSVEAYFFIPGSLGVNSRTYGADDFYGDIQNYLRFKTPAIGLDKLIDPKYRYCPFVRLSDALDEIAGGDNSEALVLKALHELKLLGCVARSDVRDHVYFLLGEIERHPESAEDGAAAFEAPAMEFLQDLERLLAKLRGLRPRLTQPGVPARVRECYLYLDEFVSLIVESYLTILFDRLMRRQDLWNRVPRLDEALKHAIEKEQKHRKQLGYPSQVDPDSDNEDFSHRRSMLKKYISSILYLDIDFVAADTAREFIFSLAAGVAMLFFVLLTVLVQSRYAMGSGAFVMVAVVGYIFKDRIKEWLKRLFTAGLAGWLTDHSVKIVDPSTREVIGRFREAMSFVPPDSVPAEIRRTRKEGREFLGGESVPEAVLKYVKKVHLEPKKIFEHHHRLKSLNDILRFSVAHFLGKMDDPKNDLLFMNPETRQLDLVRVARTYPVDVVLRLTAKKPNGDEVHYERTRLILTRKGIKRMEAGQNGKGPAQPH